MKPILILTVIWINCAIGLSLLERNELSRKFKYYFKSVRPIAKDNFSSNENGTYFTIDTEIQILNTLRVQNSASLEAFIICTFIDDRLLLRELWDRFEVTEFEPWEPRISTSPSIELKKSVFLEPQSGEITLYYRIKSTIPCSSDAWKHPFEQFNCEVVIEDGGDELLRLVDFRDVRPQEQIRVIGVEVLEWPRPTIRMFFSSDGQTTIVSIFLPSFLIFAVVVFAQWKRRKIQVIVTVTALVCVVIMLSSQRVYSSLTLRDLWLCATFLHTIFVLVIDLTLPARRVRYTLMVDVNGRPTTLASPETSPDMDSRPDSVLVRRPSSSHTSQRGVVTLASSSTQEIDQSQTIDRLPPIRWEVEEEEEDIGSPMLGGRKAILAIQKIAGMTFGETKVENQVIRGCPGQHVPIQRQITANSLGHRKRTALIGVCISYGAFILIYTLIVLCAV